MKFLYTIYALATGMLVLSSCSKGGEEFYYKKEEVLPITLKGYNGSDDQLVVKLDTFRFDYEANKPFDQTIAYSFAGNQESVKLSIREKATEKLVLEKTVKKNDGLTRIGFLYLDGKPVELPQVPTVADGKIKIRYLFRPTLTNYSGPVDIVLVKYYFLPKVAEELGRIKNVKPNEISEAIAISTFSTTGQQYNGQNTPVLFRAYIYKAGTNQFYTEGSEYTWHVTSSIVPLPSPSVTSAKVFVFSEDDLVNSIRFTKNLEL